MITPDEIIRSDRKTLSVSVDCFSRITVRAPKRCSEERIFAFLRERESWIIRKKKEMERTGMRLPPENLEGYTFMLLGKTCEIRLIDEKNIVYDGERACLYLPRNNAQKRLVKWLKENALRIFGEVTKRKAAEMGTGYKSVSISTARTRWGTCAYDNAIRYSFRLLYAPKEIIEYVVVHELAHTRHKNHSPLFWKEVEKYLPDYAARRKWLKAHGILMRIF